MHAQDGLNSPVAWERAAAEAALSEAELLQLCRDRLDNGAGTPATVRALSVLEGKNDKADLPRILKYIDDLDPAVSAAAMGALRAYGTQGLKSLRELNDRVVDIGTRKRVVERLLLDHIMRCCRRDNAINPFRLGFQSRFDELYSVEEDVDSLMLKLLREARSDIRDDISGRRYYNYRGYSDGPPFVDYGGLAVAALAKNMPEVLLQEFGELGTVEQDNDYYYYSYSARSPVVGELAIFFARNEKPALADKLISNLESSMRWSNAEQFGFTHIQIAALQAVALQEVSPALERINENIKNIATDTTITSRAHYLRARLLMELGEEGAALRALEDSMESSDQAMVMALVDDSFKPLEADRRFQAVRRYCELAVRRVPADARPWRPDVAAE